MLRYELVNNINTGMHVLQTYTKYTLKEHLRNSISYIVLYAKPMFNQILMNLNFLSLHHNFDRKW